MSDQLKLLKSKRFLPLFITQFCGAFNDNAFKNALLIWFTYDIAIKLNLNSQFMVTLAAGLFILPFFLFSATAGQLADKYEKSELTQILKLSEILLLITCPICFYFQSIYGLLSILFMLGVLATFFGPIKYSLLPEHLKDYELIAGNGLIEGGTFLAILLGTLFGSLIITTNQGSLKLSICMITIGIIGWISSKSIPNSPLRDSKLKLNYNIINCRDI
jgi:acyl-[acyl-carrier-protein]-phospholipid O-acyltransferase/long-chain-fatty-acid--[acyl-carrier-protein] ligase